MAAALVVLGLIVLTVAGVDVVWTVLAAGSGAGPLTARFSALAWRVALSLGRRGRALPPPDLGPVRAAGIPTASDADFHAAIAGDGQRRRQLAGLLAHDGWTGGAYERRRRALAG